MGLSGTMGLPGRMRPLHRGFKGALTRSWGLRDAEGCTTALHLPISTLGLPTRKAKRMSQVILELGTAQPTREEMGYGAEPLLCSLCVNRTPG
jgi:hypothetical protein